MIDRRGFLVSSALLASGVAAIKTGKIAAASKVRCGVLGLGHAHALDVVEVLKASEDFELAGVCEPDPVVRADVEKSTALSGVTWLEQDELLRDDTVKMVAVESVVEKLLDYAHAAADARKHVHLDKPAGTSLSAFKALLDKLEQRDLLLQMGYMYRYNAGFDFARRAVREGLLGDVYRINGCIDTDYTPEKRKRLAGRPGGMMFELGCHLLDMAMLMLGAPKKVTPFLRHDLKQDDNLFDNTCAVFDYDTAMVVIESSAMRPNAFPTRRFEVCGTNGCVTVEPHEPPTVRLNLRKARGEFKGCLQGITVEDQPRHVRDFQDLARCIRGEARFVYSKKHDLDVQRALLRASGVNSGDAILNSRSEGRSVI